MAILNGLNYAKSQAFPIEKTDPSEVDTRVKCVSEKYDMSTLGVVLANGDEILGPFIPEGAKIVDAAIKIDTSMGASGILDMGLKAFTNKAGTALVEDQNALVNQADAGGQAVFKRSLAGDVGIGQQVGLGGAQIFAKCTEASTTTNNIIEMFVFYMLES